MRKFLAEIAWLSSWTSAAVKEYGGLGPIVVVSTADAAMSSLPSLIAAVEAWQQSRRYRTSAGAVSRVGFLAAVKSRFARVTKGLLLH